MGTIRSARNLLVTNLEARILFLALLSSVVHGFCSTAGSREPGGAPKVPTAASLQDPPTYSGDIGSREAIPFFILVGDTQRTSRWGLAIGRDQNDSVRELLLTRIADENPAFLIILGDLVFQGDDAYHWRLFDQFAAPIRQKGIPVFPLFGNHEYFGNDRKAFRHFFSRFPHLNGQFWSTVRFGSVAIILLNSNFKHMSRELANHQDQWYRARLTEYQNDHAVKTIIVCCHHPPFTNSRVVPDDKEVKEHFGDPFEATPKAKLFFSGHSHAYERFMFGKQFVVSGGGGGPRQKVVVDKAKQRHPDEYDGGELRPFHFCKVLVEPDRLVVQMIRLDEGLRWSIGDEFLVR